MNKFLYYLIHKPGRLMGAAWKHIGAFLPDEPYLKVMFRLVMGKNLDLRSPKTFSEKLQWLKLYDHNPDYTMMVDKYAVKEYVAKKIGSDYIIPTLGVWDRAEDIDWDNLPNEFVLKCTHDSGGLVICKDKSKLDKEEVVKKLNGCLKRDFYKLYREWPYKNVPHRIIAEQYIGPLPEVKDLPDYKFFCFNGEPKYCQVISGRATKMCIDFFDKDWNHQPFHEPKQYPFADFEPTKPSKYEVMWEIAAKLASGKTFSRIDFYEVDGKIYFGEITFFPTTGMGGFAPASYDKMFGEMLELPKL